MNNTNISKASTGELSKVFDIEQGRVEEFAESILGVRQTQVIETYMDFDDRTPVRQAINRFMSFEYRGVPTLYLDENLKNLGSIALTGFTPRVARGGKNSAHGVFFGDLLFEEISVPVAVKPHTIEGATRSSLTDHFNGVAVNKLGLFALQPAGCLLNNEQRGFSLTMLDETLTTLDTIDWTNFYPDVEDHPGMMQIWSQVARQLGLLHSTGAMSHGDLAGRNIAVTADNYAFLIDWERAHISTHQPLDAEIRYEFSHPDLASLLESMSLPEDNAFKAGLGIFYGKKGELSEWWEGFKTLFFDEYLSIRREIAETSNNKQLLAEVERELQALNISLLNDMKMMHDICREIENSRKNSIDTRTKTN